MMVPLLAIALLCGCRTGDGWARIEPLAGGPAVETQVFDPATAALAAPIDRTHPIRPLVITGQAEVENVAGDVVRRWTLLACATPSDVPSRVNVVAMVARQDGRRKPVWQLYTGGGDLEFWQYEKHCMLYGQVHPRGADEPDAAAQVFSGCVTGEADLGRFRKEAAKLLVELARQRSALPADSELRAELDEAEWSIRKAMGVSAGKKRR